MGLSMGAETAGPPLNERQRALMGRIVDRVPALLADAYGGALLVEAHAMGLHTEPQFHLRSAAEAEQGGRCFWISAMTASPAMTRRAGRRRSWRATAGGWRRRAVSGCHGEMDGTGG
jgi:hypothetical protein